ncbi:MAG: STAS domain-containing protein [Spirochaetia bacterium]|nr:STAS domain-containing protein [Spirochaetia bacterium]
MIEINEGILNVVVNEKRIEGSNHIFEHLVEESKISDKDKVKKIIFDFANVEYINSLGIAEFISIIRYYTNVTNAVAKYKFINVNKDIRKLFSLVELGHLVEISESSG